MNRRGFLSLLALAPVAPALAEKALEVIATPAPLPNNPLFTGAIGRWSGTLIYVPNTVDDLKVAWRSQFDDPETFELPPNVFVNEPIPVLSTPYHPEPLTDLLKGN